MPEKDLYEYAVIRVVPRIEREEFINVGLLLFCKRKRYIRIRIAVNEQKLALYSTECEKETLLNNLSAWEIIASGQKEGGYMASLDVAERFRWLTAVRSATIQTSRPHSGYTHCLDETFDRLFGELVL
ncbi:MAG: DUF3037 domain-containing protein [Bacteroides sp.]|nr:DUF3037 domain-containing protein [Bacteroides sp.]